MTDQSPLFTWTDRYPVGTQVRNRHTGTVGTVEAVDPGERLHIRWKSSSRWPDYVCTQGSELGLERIA